MSPLYIKQINGYQFTSRLHSYKRKNNRYPDVHIIDIDFAKDVSVITYSLINSNTLLHTFEDTTKD